MNAHAMADGTERPEFREMSRNEIDALLDRNRVGRVAYARPDGQIEIRQIHYVRDGDWIFGRTSWSDKVESMTRYWWAAFAVDEIDGRFDWRSVVVHGGLYPLLPEGGPSDVERYRRAVDALRRIIPETMTPEDPVPFRGLIVGIAVQELHGRAASSQPDGAQAPSPGADSPTFAESSIQ